VAQENRRSASLSKPRAPRVSMYAPAVDREERLDGQIQTDWT
jgi:hypothetical protein